MVVAKRRSMLSAGLFDETLPALEDYELWLQMAKRSMRFFLIQTPLTKYHHITKSKSITKSLSATISARNIIDRKFEEDRKSLSKKEKRMQSISRSKADVFISHLNKNHSFALKTSIKSLFKHRSLLFLWLFLTSLPGSGFFIAINTKAKLLLKN